MSSDTPIARHGAIGDMETIGLVSADGSLDWWCWPRFDSPSLFGRLLDPDGGRWSIRPAEPCEGEQLYLSGTNVLVTRFSTASGVVEVEDLMRVDGSRGVCRTVRCFGGSVDMEVELTPRPDYGRGHAEVTAAGDGAAIDVGPERLVLRSSVPVVVDGGARVPVSARFTVEPATPAAFVLEPDTGPSSDRPGETSLVDAVEEVSHHTLHWWRSWTDRGSYRGRWREAVERSALALKLLTHRDSGAVLAAGTTSLPEVVGGPRNWDYRYVWMRDAAFAVYAFLEVGHREEARAFSDWVIARLDRCEEREVEPLDPLYDLDGRAEIPETELDHWRGYAGSRPVRIGNGASEQRQLDIYGEVIDALYLTDKHSDGLPLDTWTHICTLVDHVIANWDQPDHGMWEARCEPQRHTSSLLMCWVAVERAIRMATRRGRPADLARWRRARDEMHATMLADGWNDDVGAFTRVLGDEHLDASILLAPLVRFLPGSDPRWQSTLDVVGRALAAGPLVHRYDTDLVADGVGGEEGAFTMCSFWYVEALARAGRIDDARAMFDRLLSYASPVGLFSEEIGPDGQQLGNVPQAFTHLSLISAAVYLDEALDGVRNGAGDGT